MALVFHVYGKNWIRTEVYTFSELSSMMRAPMYAAHGTSRSRVIRVAAETLGSAGITDLAISGGSG
jgi:hypothetical protein